MTTPGGDADLGPARLELLPSGHCLVTLAGEVDLAVVPDLITEFEYAVAHLSPHLVVDVNAVGFIDSSGLGALVRTRRIAQEQGGELALVGANPQMGELLALTRLDELFSLHESVDAAVAGTSFEPPPR